MKDISNKGDITVAKILTALIERGKRTLKPFSDSIRYDLAIDENGKLSRIQCKTGILRDGVITYRTCSVHKVETGYKHRNYLNEVEYFGVYCPENGKCYLVPATSNKQTATLRVDGRKNKRSRLAREFEI